MTITQEKLKELFRYDEKTGDFIRRTEVRCGRGGGRLVYGVGSKAGSSGSHCQGYTRIKINGRLYRAHRLAWLYMHGVWPDHEIDHKDRCRSNNAKENMRPASDSENMQNTPVRRDNKSGCAGVFRRRSGRWSAYIDLDRRRRNLGTFDDLEDAIEFRNLAKDMLHTHHKERPNIT